jgi:hypothetical protein
VIGPGQRGTVRVIAVVIAVATMAFYWLTEKFAQVAAKTQGSRLDAARCSRQPSRPSRHCPSWHGPEPFSGPR